MDLYPLTDKGPELLELGIVADDILLSREGNLKMKNANHSAKAIVVGWIHVYHYMECLKFAAGVSALSYADRMKQTKDLHLFP